MVDVKQQGSHFESGEVATRRNRLRGDVFYSLAGVKAYDVIFALVETLDQAFDGERVQVPHRISLLVIQLGRSVKHELAERGHSFSPDLLVLVGHHFCQQLSKAALSYLVANDSRVPDQLSKYRAESELQVRTLDVFEQFGEQVHEGGVDEAVGDVGVEDDALEVNEHVELVVDGA